MSIFNPNIEDLLRKKNISKPNETFEVGVISADPTETPLPLNHNEFTNPQESLLKRLETEAAKIQDIINIITDTASELSVPTPAEDQPFIGTTISTTEYLKSLETTET